VPASASASAAAIGRLGPTLFGCSPAWKTSRKTPNATMFNSTAIILALSDIHAFVVSTNKNSVASLVILSMGETWARPRFGLFAISFFAGLLGNSTAIGRIV
jgi:hypothetical protein